MGGESNGRKKALHFHHSPNRVISLVPSLTESLFDLGLGEAVVGITDFCIYPQELLKDLPRLGGPKNPKLADILALEPDLVLANQEENTRQAVESLEAGGVRVWVTFPQTVRQAMDVLWALAGVFQSKVAAIRLETLEMTLEWAQSAAAERRLWRYFCPIWQDRTAAGKHWWMTFNQHTYAHDLLNLMGGENVFAVRERCYPLNADLGEGKPQDTGGRDTRYPRVTLEEILDAAPEMILLPSEPFTFSDTHLEELMHLFSETPAARQGRIHLVDGSLVTWHGTRLARALETLPSIFSL